jgi:hypothetical protein
MVMNGEEIKEAFEFLKSNEIQLGLSQIDFVRSLMKYYITQRLTAKEWFIDHIWPVRLEFT